MVLPRSAPHSRWLIGVLALLVAVVAGCASTVPQFQADRCHRAERERDTLYWDIICIIQSP
jgi:hypothetical protein